MPSGNLGYDPFYGKRDLTEVAEIATNSEISNQLLIKAQSSSILAMQNELDKVDSVFELNGKLQSTIKHQEVLIRDLESTKMTLFGIIFFMVVLIIIILAIGNRKKL
jgi:hypothetical protein